VQARIWTRGIRRRLDGQLSRLGPLVSALFLTVAAMLLVVPTHFLIRYLQGAAPAPQAVINLVIEMFLVLLPIIFLSRRNIAALKRSRAELAQVSRRLQVAAEEAHHANRAKSLFLANMSHELRTPLNAIMGFSEVMKDQHMGPVNNPRYLSYARDIHASGRYLLGIINDILDLSKIEAGKMSLESAEEFALTPTVRSAMGMIANLGEQFSVTLIDELPEDGVRLLAVERMLRQIVINLVGNAIKFTPAGGTVRVGGRRLANGGYEIYFRDSGVGMREEDIAVAVTPFGQIANMTGAKHTGTGLGLPLAKAMMELHCGTMSIASALDKGTTVMVTFPASRVVDEPGAAQRVA
jgi:signal transduction histidine kinase